MQLNVTSAPFGQDRHVFEILVKVKAETPSELMDCEAWRRKHRLHKRAIPIEHWPYGGQPAPRELQRDLDELAQDRAIEVMLLWDRPFSWNTLEQDENTYGFRLHVERTGLIPALLERLEEARCIDEVTLAIEQLLLEKEHQTIHTVVRTRRASRC